MDDASDRIRRVATVFTPQDYAVTKSFLEAHGILVLGTSHNFIIAAARPDSLGGLGILVPARQAQEAINLLIEVDRIDKSPEAVSTKPVKQRSRSFFNTIRDFFFYTFIEEKSPVSQSTGHRLIHGEWKNSTPDSPQVNDSEKAASHTAMHEPDPEQPHPVKLQQ